MQLVSDYQQRPKKARLKMEKRIVMFYDLCSIVQLVTFLVHTVTTTIAAKRTFGQSYYVNQDFQLSPTLVYKTENCSFETTRNIYAFTEVSMNWSASNVNDVFVDLAIQTRLAVFVCAVTFFIGALNRSFVEMDFFVFKYKNFYIWKDISSATELILLAYIFQIAASVSPPASLLRDYLQYCGVQSEIYLPFQTNITLFVFAGVGYFTYLVGLVLYCYNACPKYGIMTEAEIQEYKMWLRARRAEKEQSRLLIEEAKKAHARLQMMESDEYMARAAAAGGAQGDGRASMGMSRIPPGMVMGPDGTLYPGMPFPYSALPPTFAANPSAMMNFPPPQVFGGGGGGMMMPGYPSSATRFAGGPYNDRMPSVSAMPPSVPPIPLSGPLFSPEQMTRGMAPPSAEFAMPPSTQQQQQQQLDSMVNMPRRRVMQQSARNTSVNMPMGGSP